MKIILVVAAAVVIWTGPAVAQTGRDVDVTFGASQIRLMAAGYTQISMTEKDPLRLRALDSEGSEVSLVINSRTGEIDSKTYHHGMDE